jgi:hypothetical protein
VSNEVSTAWGWREGQVGQLASQVRGRQLFSQTGQIVICTLQPPTLCVALILVMLANCLFCALMLFCSSLEYQVASVHFQLGSGPMAAFPPRAG